MGKKEYGGYLPIELNPGKEYFYKYEDLTYRFNSVKAALCFLIRELGKSKILVPYYYCPSTIEAIKKTGVTIEFYHIENDFSPIGLPDEKDSMVLLVDYFGVGGDTIAKTMKILKNSEIIIDRAHAFFAQPVICDHTHNLYSAKKFFGVPDGAYLISNFMFEREETSSVAYKYANYLLKAYEEGTNAAYTEKKETDKKLAHNYDNMSVLSRGLLGNVDYERVRKQRVNNYRILHDDLAGINRLDIPEQSPAYMFPLLIPEKGDVVKKKLVERSIFTPTLWSGQELIVNGYDFEIDMMNNGIFLPIDQRYCEKDMDYIASCVIEALE